MIEIPVLGRYENFVTKISDEDFKRISAVSWRANKINNKIYVGSHIYNSITDKTEYWFLHRFILNVPPGDPRLVDHKDRNPLNNQRDNLRACSSSENSQNKSVKRNQITTSLYKGVLFLKKEKNWGARIQFQNKPICLGSYFEEIDAALAYDKAALHFFKDFANLNFDKETPKDHIKVLNVDYQPENFTSKYFGVYYSENAHLWIGRIGKEENSSNKLLCLYRHEEDLVTYCREYLILLNNLPSTRNFEDLSREEIERIIGEKEVEKITAFSIKKGLL